MTTSCYCWSWRSLHRRTNAGIVWVSASGDYALFNSNHIPDGTTDNWPSYQDLPGVWHNAITLGPMAAHVALPWIHRLFSNLKRWGLGVYHGLRKTNLQHYLDEFVFRFNRRRTRHAAFDTLLGIGARTTPAPYHVLIRKAA